MFEKLFDFIMVLMRISTFILVVPVFGWKTIPHRVKIATALLLSFFFSTTSSSVVASGQISVLRAILLISNEAIYGLALGLIVVIVFSAVTLGGRIIERQMGLAMSQTLNPLSGELSQSLSMLIEMFFVLMFLSANGHHLLLLIISRSYETFPAGSIPTIPFLVSGIIKAGSTMFIVCLQLAAPMLAVFLLLLVILAVFARMMPDMNILFISMPLRVGLGLLMVGTFLPFINEFVGEFADWMNKLLPL